MKAKRIIAAVLAVLMILSLAACGGSNNTASDKNYVYWLNFKPELDETLQELAAKYKESKKVDVKIVTPESGKYSETLSEELKKSEPPTMFVLSNQQEANKLKKYTFDLKETPLVSELSSDTYNLYDDTGKLAAVGYCYECFGIIVNKELVELLGYKVDEIKSFDKLKEVVEFIHNNASWLGFDAFAASDLDDDSAWKYTAHMANIDYFYEERDASGWDECPSSISGEYLNYYKNLYDLVINNSIAKPEDLNSSDYNARDEFNAKMAAFYLSGSWEYEAVKESIPSAVMIPYYCGIEGEEKAGLCCGTENYLAINSKLSEENRKTTLNFIDWLINNSDASAALVKQLGIMPFKNAADTDNGFLKNASKYTERRCYNMDWAFSYQPNKEQYRVGIVDARKEYNKDQTDANWKKVKTAFVDGWAEQYAAEKEETEQSE